MKTTPLLTALTLALPFAANAGTHTWVGGGGSTNWSNPANWSSGGVPAAGETAPVVLIFPSNATAHVSTPNIPNLAVDRIEISNSSSQNVGYSFPSAGVMVNLTGSAGDNFRVNASSNNIPVLWQAPLNLQATSRVRVEGSPYITLDCAISGTGGLTKTGSGLVVFEGATANTFTGPLRIETGTASLNKAESTNAFAGNLDLAGGTCNISRSHQIPSNVQVTVEGTLKTAPAIGVSSVSEGIGAVVFRNTGIILAGSDDLITLGGNVSCADVPNTSGTLKSESGGEISLGLLTRTFTTPDDTSIWIEADLTSAGGFGAGINKTGPGVMNIRVATSFAGSLQVQQGNVRLGHSNALGGTGDTVVSAGASLELGESTGITLPATEALTVAGTLKTNRASTVSGSVILNGTPTLHANASQSLTLSGVVSGSGAPSVSGFAPVIFSGTASNTFSGMLSMTASGTLHLNKTSATAVPGAIKFESDNATVKLLAPNQIADSGSVWMAQGGTFDLDSKPETIAGLYGAGAVGGRVVLGNATLTLNQSSALQFGSAGGTGPASISGTNVAKVRKLGAGTWTLHHQPDGSPITHPILSVEGGSTVLNGEWRGPVYLVGGFLRGQATTGPISGMGGSVFLSDFTTSGFSGTANILAGINGDAPGSGYDRLIATGPVNLTGQTLQASLGAFTPMTMGRYTIIDNDSGVPVTGTFLGLPEGATFMLNGQPFKITYQGGRSGRDVQLVFTGTGTPGPAITRLVKSGTTITLTVRGGANQELRIDRANDGLGSWSSLGYITMDAAGNKTFVTTNANASAFYRLTVE